MTRGTQVTPGCDEGLLLPIVVVYGVVPPDLKKPEIGLSLTFLCETSANVRPNRTSKLSSNF